MSLESEIIVTAEKKDISVTVEPSKSATIETQTAPGLVIVAAGNVGPPGPAGRWVGLTQSEYDLLNPPDPDTLYVIIQ
jgi:hypothetical protein